MTKKIEPGKDGFIVEIMDGMPDQSKNVKEDSEGKVPASYSKLSDLIKAGMATELRSELEYWKKIGRLEITLGLRDKERRSLLDVAAIASQYESMEILVNLGADPCGDQFEDAVWSPLHYFAKFGKDPTKIDKDKPFFNMFADVDMECNQNIHGETPLHIAAKRGNVFTTKLLLDKPEINTEERDFEGRSAMDLAVQFNHPEIVRMLIRQGCKANEGDVLNNTSLHVACRNNSTDVVKVILEECPDRDWIARKNSSGESPFQLALRNNNKTVAKMLIDSCDTESTTPEEMDEQFALHIASSTGSLVVVQLLTQLGVHMNLLNDDKKSPLFLAAENDMTEVAKILIKAGADPNQFCCSGQTSLMVAAKEGHLDTVRTLIEHNANIDLFDESEKNALHYAVLNDDAELAKVLLKSDADKSTMNDQDNLSNTPLHIAVEHGNVEVAEYLVEQGASLLVRNQSGNYPIHLAVSTGQTRVIEFLLQQNRSLIHFEGIEDLKPLSMASYFKNTKTAAILLKYGPPDVQRAFEWSVMRNDLPTAKLLHKHGALVDGSWNSVWKPLEKACELGLAEMVSLLLENGANLQQENYEKKTPAMKAIESTYDSKTDVIEKIVADNKYVKLAMRGCIDKDHDKAGKVKVPWTPLRLMIAKCPEMALTIMDTCFTRDLDTLDNGFDCITADYEFLDDAFNFNVIREDKGKMYRYSTTFKEKPYTTDRAVLIENHPLMLMVTQNQKHLLKHPMCSTLLKEKWNKYGRFIYFGMLFFYVSFLASLTAFSLVISNPGLTSAGNANESVNKSSAQTSAVSQWLVIILASLGLVARSVNLIRTRRSYLTFGNFFDALVHVAGLIFAIDLTAESIKTGLRTEWQWQLGAVTITAAWLNLLSICRNLPLFGIYVIMFIDILKTFSRFGAVFGIFIVAFGMGFHMLLQVQTPFTSVGKSLLKTSVMMIGEFEFEGIFYSDSGADYLTYPGMTYAFFVGFLIIMSIIIVNLLVGLAVDDIKAVQDQAEIKRLAMQVEQVLDVERLLPMYLLKHFITNCSFEFEKGCDVYNDFIEYMEANHMTLGKTNKRSQKDISEDMRTFEEKNDKRFDTLERKLDALTNLMTGNMEPVKTVPKPTEDIENDSLLNWGP